MNKKNVTIDIFHNEFIFANFSCLIKKNCYKLEIGYQNEAKMLITMLEFQTLILAPRRKSISQFNDTAQVHLPDQLHSKVRKLIQNE